MARQPTTTDVFNAVGDPCRREILDALAGGESTVGAVVAELGMAQPQVSKHLRVLREVDLVRCRRVGREHFYRVHATALAPLHQWLARLTESLNAHYDRLDDYLDELSRPATTHSESEG